MVIEKKNDDLIKKPLCSLTNDKNCREEKEKNYKRNTEERKRREKDRERQGEPAY